MEELQEVTADKISLKVGCSPSGSGVWSDCAKKIEGVIAVSDSRREVAKSSSRMVSSAYD